MTNFEAIQKMDAATLEWFLEMVFITGMNSDNFIVSNEDKLDSLSPKEITELQQAGDNPYNLKWLMSEAEPATLGVLTEESDPDLPKAFIKSISRATGIDMSGL